VNKLFLEVFILVQTSFIQETLEDETADEMTRHVAKVALHNLRTLRDQGDSAEKVARQARNFVQMVKIAEHDHQ